MNHLLIFIKNPIKGKAKTRLAATVGDEEALRIYKRLLQHTRNVTQEIEAKRLLFYSHFLEMQDEWEVTKFDKRLQTAGDLGEKMADGFRQAFEEGATKAVIVGSDCASLTPAILTVAFAELEKHDFVVGPAEDGGYYLLGMKYFLPDVFQNIAWSTAEVLAQTLKNMELQAKTYSFLPVLSDIDTEEDWQKHGLD